ncbi:hypothetical protein HK097_001112 [Rhizophlyctis rosea]|uniref:DJ-1/PfpI domain-containing protein n=1 Tax=Rhizophlyctis rosea TaxID=64517 RepID=A0AAD5SCR9_9FUNG|nr:hypothetical protein HK097_001112 [Rhizophlyctis rosea]
MKFNLVYITLAALASFSTIVAAHDGEEHGGNESSASLGSSPTGHGDMSSSTSGAAAAPTMAMGGGHGSNSTSGMPGMPSGGHGNMTTGEPMFPKAPPLSIGVLLFPGFTTIDVFGPLEYFNALSAQQNITLSLISVGSDLTPVSSAIPSHEMTMSDGSVMVMNTPGLIGQSLVPTHTFSNAPKLDLFLVPGGLGSRSLVRDNATLDFVRARWADTQYFATVCTGSGIAAKAGVLDGYKATGNKQSWTWTKQQSDKVNWVPEARWVVDRKAWTSSGATAGMDMTYALITKIYSEAQAKYLAEIMEYEPHTDPSWDPFAVVWGAVSKNSTNSTTTSEAKTGTAAMALVGALSML